MKENLKSLKFNQNSKILFIDACNFENYPLGGTLSFAKQMMGAFKQQLVLVGITTDNKVPIGKWTKVIIDEKQYDFFAIRRMEKSFKKPLIPNRIKNYLALHFYSKQIKNYPKKIKNVFIQSPDTLLAIRRWNYKNVCFRSPGVVNMLIASRFWYAKYFANLSQFFIYKALKNVSVILASADQSSINNFTLKSYGYLNPKDIVQFPTRIDTSIFRPLDKTTCRLN